MLYVELLSRHQLAELDKLQLECREFDGNQIAIYKHLLHKPRPFPSCLLYYKDNKLVGFLRAFFFYNEEAEISLMVAPHMRRQGIARQLLTAIIPLLQHQSVNTITFSVPYGMHQSWLSHLGFDFYKSQYMMQYDITKPLKFNKTSAHIRLATMADITTLCEIHRAGFPKEAPEMEHHFASLVRDPEYVIFVLEENGMVLGKAHIRFDTSAACLADLAVLTAYRGQGYGRALIQHSIYHALLRNRTLIYLDIEADNHRAFKLYTSIGFYKSNAHDYWRRSINLAEFSLTHFQHPL